MSSSRKKRTKRGSWMCLTILESQILWNLSGTSTACILLDYFLLPCTTSCFISVIICLISAWCVSLCPCLWLSSSRHPSTPLLVSPEYAAPFNQFASTFVQQPFLFIISCLILLLPLQRSWSVGDQTLGSWHSVRQLCPCFLRICVRIQSVGEDAGANTYMLSLWPLSNAHNHLDRVTGAVFPCGRFELRWMIRVCTSLLMTTGFVRWYAARLTVHCLIPCISQVPNPVATQSSALHWPECSI